MDLLCVLRTFEMRSGRTRSYIVSSDTLKSAPSGRTDSDRSLSEPVDRMNGYLHPMSKPSPMTAHCACLLPVIFILTATSWRSARLGLFGGALDDPERAQYITAAMLGVRESSLLPPINPLSRYSLHARPFWLSLDEGSRNVRRCRLSLWDGC